MGRRKPRGRPPDLAADPPPQRWWRIGSSASLVVGLLGLLLGSLLVALCPGGREGARREGGLDVLLVTVDTLRADAVGAYSRRPGVTPTLDALAEDGVVFSEARAHNVVTLPSHANILSGRLPFDHGVRDNAGFRFPSALPTLATLLREQGYRTGAFVSAFPLDSRFGLDRGFDVYDDGFADGASADALTLPERPGPQTVAAARRWLTAAGGRPSFTWVHVYEPHAPYLPPPPFDARFATEAYLGEAAAADAALAPLLEPLLAASRRGRTLVVMTADHGESLGEHGEKTHGIFAYEATVRVPLILFAPRLFGPRVDRRPAGHTDVLPTVLDALGLKAPAGLPGRSLLDPGDDEAHATYVEALSGMTTRGWAPVYGLVRDGLKVLDLPLPELYDLRKDPSETLNLAASRPQDLERLRAALRSLRAADRGAVRQEETRAARERLRALGYLAASAPIQETYTEEDDPKRLIDLDALMETVLARHRAGDLEGALAVCRELVERRPQMPASLVQMALLQRKLGRLGEATAALRQVLALSPEDAGAAALLGSYLNEAGLWREAADLLEPYSQRAEPAFDVLVARGVALAQLGRRKEALTHLDRARRVDPSNPMTLVHAATVRLLSGELAAARRALEESLAISPGLSIAHHSLGLVAAREGRDEEALAHWREAVRLNPREYDALLNLGALLVRRGRPAEARPFLESFAAGAPRPLYDRELGRVRSWLSGPGGRRPT